MPFMYLDPEPPAVHLYAQMAVSISWLPFLGLYMWNPFFGGDQIRAPDFWRSPNKDGLG